MELEIFMELENQIDSEEDTIDKWINYKDYHSETIISTAERERIIHAQFRSTLNKVIAIAKERENINKEIIKLKKIEDYDSCSSISDIVNVLYKRKNALSKQLYNIIFSVPSDLQERILIVALKYVYKDYFKTLNEKKKEDKIKQKIDIILQKVKEIQNVNPNIRIKITKSFIKNIFPQLNSKRVNKLWKELQKNMSDLLQS